MIYSLKGELIYTDATSAVVECAGVGYRCWVSLTTLSQLPPKGRQAKLYTYMTVREDSVDLFGFVEETELECFRKLTSVNGVGAKVALSLLSDLTPDRLVIAIASGDEKALTRAPGVGKKIAQRILLELREKLGAISSDNAVLEKVSAVQNSTGARSEAAAALVMLGYSQSEAALTLAGCDDSLTVEEMIKLALKQLSKQTQR